MGGIEIVLKDKDGNVKQAIKKDRRNVPGVGAIVEEFVHDEAAKGTAPKWEKK
jgi:hypothetical protein